MYVVEMDPQRNEIMYVYSLTNLWLFYQEYQKSMEDAEEKVLAASQIYDLVS